MNRDVMREFRDVNLKPNKNDEETLRSIIASPLMKLKEEQVELLWKFRYYLRKNKKALTKVRVPVCATCPSVSQAHRTHHFFSSLVP